MKKSHRRFVSFDRDAKEITFDSISGEGAARNQYSASPASIMRNGPFLLLLVLVAAVAVAIGESLPATDGLRPMAASAGRLGDEVTWMGPCMSSATDIGRV